MVLIHGAGTGSWVWDRMAPLLTGPALAVDLPGRASVPADPRTVTLDDAVEAVEAQVRAWDGRPVVVVAHSLGGMLVPGLADRLSDRLVSCVLVGAAVPLEGGTLLRAMGFPWSLLLRGLFALQPGGTKPPARSIRRVLAHDVDRAATDELVERYVKEPRGYYTEPAGAVPSSLEVTYVKLLRDRSQISPRRQDRMIRSLGAPTVAELDTGHMAMLADPPGLAAIVDDAVASAAR